MSKKFYTRYLFPVVITDNKYVPGDNPDGGKEESDETWMDIEDAMYERVMNSVWLWQISSQSRCRRVTTTEQTS